MSCIDSLSTPVVYAEAHGTEQSASSCAGVPAADAVATNEMRTEFLALGHPLMDATVTKPRSYVEEQGLNHGGWMMPNKPEHFEVYRMLQESPDVKYTIGGSAFNTVKVIQKMVGKSFGFAGGIGSIGNDKVGQHLKEEFQRKQVKPLFVTREGETTGQCGILVDPENAARTMVTDLGAGSTFTVDDLIQFEEYIRKCRMVLSSAYMFKNPNGVGMLQALADMMESNTATLVFALAAAPLIEDTIYKEYYREFLPRTNIVVANDEEAEAYYNSLIPPEERTVGAVDLEEICKIAARHIATLPMDPKDRVLEYEDRVVVITRGKKPVVLAVGEKVTLHSLPAVPKEKVVDTNGAGDTFLGGFLAAILEGASFEQGLKLGHACASQMIQVLGCELDCLDKLTEGKDSVVGGGLRLE